MVVETSAFVTEVVLCNVTHTTVTVKLSYVAAAVAAPSSTAAVTIDLAAGEQRIIPAFVQFLRGQHAPGVGPSGATFAGALFLTVEGQDTGGVFLGGRTETAKSGGRYGLFYTALAKGDAASSTAWLYGLRRDAENRTNLALVNTGNDATAIGLHVDLFDGATGAAAGSFDVASLPPHGWTQQGVAPSGASTTFYARVTRTSGTNPFLAYATVVDGGTPQTRSDDGAFVAFQVQEPAPSADLAAVKTVEAKAQSLLASGASQLDFVHGVAAFMATMPEYKVTGLDEPSLTAYGVFADGRVHLVTNNRVADAVPQAFSTSSPASGRAALATELPSSGWARLLQSFGETAWTQEPVNDIAALLEDPGGYGIRIGRVGDATLPALRQVSGDGFVYFNTHGGRYTITNASSATRYYSLQSSTLVTPQSEIDNKDDLDAGRLTYFTAPNQGTVVDPVTGKQVDSTDSRFGIDGAFVQHYWHFAPDSIFFVNACWSAYTQVPEGPQDFIDACFQAGLGLFLGWNEKANSGTCYTAARYFVDRLIGANKFMPESPYQRAFNWEAVLADMQMKGLTHDKVTGADLTPFPRPGGNSILLDPSIQTMYVDEFHEMLTLKGIFGTKQGKVLVVNGDQTLGELSGCTWASTGDKIDCALPRTGTLSHGDIVVALEGELGRLRKSNVHQLTEWDIPIHYKWTPPTADGKGGTVMPYTLEGMGTVRFRADIGSWRDKPAGQETFPVRGLRPTQDSSITVTGSGSLTVMGCTSTLSGTGTFVGFTAKLSSSIPLELLAAGKVDAKTHAGGIGLEFGAAGSIPITMKNSCAPLPIPFPPLFGGDPDTFPSPTEDSSFAITLPAIPITFDDKFQILAAKFVDPKLVLTVDWHDAVAPMPAVRTDLAR